MLEFSRNTGNTALAEYWAYVLEALDILKHDCMSDEEDVEENITTEDGVDTTRKVRIVKLLWFRHESFRPLFETIDATRGLEDLIFHQSGATRIPRKRVAVVDSRLPPKGLPKSVFRQEYLDKLDEYAQEELQFRAEDFEIRQ